MKTNMGLKPNGKIHPIAAAFPMMSDEELAALAANIKTTGLLNPIVLDDDGTLIDGRNREAACKLAGIAPKYVGLNGQDPVAFIFGNNAARRHMTKGQLAMVAVKSESLETNDSFRRGTVQRLSNLSGVSHSRISQALLVFQYAAELMDQVINGALSLDDAYDEAKQRQAEADSAEKQMKRLRSEANDLADLVTEERMKLPEAWAVVRERKAQRRQQQESVTRQLNQCVGFLNPRAYTVAQHVEEIATSFDPNMSQEEIDREVLAKCAAVLSGLSKHFK
jgi:ParB/Sulfiredoxin domain